MATKLLTREQILKANDMKKEVVQVPEWGGAVMVRSLSAKERDEYEASMLRFKGKQQEINLRNARTKLAVIAICDEDGRPTFTETDLTILSGKNAAAMQRVFEVAQRLSGITDEDIEEMTKNSESAQSEDSSSD